MRVVPKSLKRLLRPRAAPAADHALDGVVLESGDAVLAVFE
jgi:hypothetical protein